MFGAAPEKKTERDIYAKAGTEYAAAFEKMAAEIKEPHRPPSLEVFQHELQDRSKGWKRVSPTELATKLIRESADALA